MLNGTSKGLIESQLYLSMPKTVARQHYFGRADVAAFAERVNHWCKRIQFRFRWQCRGDFRKFNAMESLIHILAHLWLLYICASNSCTLYCRRTAARQGSVRLYRVSIFLCVMTAVVSIECVGERIPVPCGLIL